MGDRTSTLTALLKDSVSGPAAKIRGEFNELHTSAGKLGAVLQGIGVGVGIGIFNALSDGVRALSNAIPDLVNKAFAFTNMVDELGDATGASAEETSRLIGTYQLLGISTDNLSTRMGQLSRVVVNNEATVNRYGIATRDANGHLLNQVEIADNARQALSRYESGTAKAAVMVKLFGRAGLDMADFLSLSDEQVRIITDDLEQMGVILDSGVAEQAERAKIEMRRFDLGMQGLANTLLANILPALIPAISGVTNFVRDNAKAIAQFMAQVVNFVMGMIAALTGANFTAATFTDTLGEVGGAATESSGGLDKLVQTTKKSGGASKAATAEYQDQIKHLDRMTESVKRLDAAQDARFEKEIAQLTGVADAQIAAIDAADRQRSVDEQRASGLRDIADAEAAVAAAQAEGTDPTDALRRLADVRARAAEFERDQADDARKEQLSAVKQYIENIAEAEEAWASKKGLLEQLKKNEAILNADLARAREEGNVQAVADLTLRLEAVKAAERRTQLAAANEERTKELEDQKIRYEELVKAAQAAGSGIGAGITAGAIEGGAAITTMVEESGLQTQHLSDFFNGPEGLTAAMDEARLAGEKFGDDVKAAIDDVLDAVQGLIDLIGALGRKLDEAALGLRFLTDPQLQQQIKDAGGIPGLSGALDIIGGIGDLLNPFDKKSPFAPSLEPRAHGGPTLPGQTYWVGEEGPEILRMGNQGGSIIPNGATGGNVTINVGTINGVQDAKGLLQDLQREVQRQGMRLVAS